MILANGNVPRGWLHAIILFGCDEQMIGAQIKGSTLNILMPIFVMDVPFIDWKSAVIPLLVSIY